MTKPKPVAKLSKREYELLKARIRMGAIAEYQHKNWANDVWVTLDTRTYPHPLHLLESARRPSFSLNTLRIRIKRNE